MSYIENTFKVGKDKVKSSEIYKDSEEMLVNNEKISLFKVLH